MTRFYTRLEAAEAIATQLHPDDGLLREEVAERYFNALYDALCEGALVGRWPDTWLPIEHPNMRLPAEYRNLAGAIALGGCVISETDLNGWLAELGIDISIHSAPAREPSAQDLLEEKLQMQGDGVRNAHARLASKYGLPVRRVKYLCERAAGLQKPKSGDASSGLFPIQRVRNGKRVQ